MWHGRQGIGLAVLALTAACHCRRAEARQETHDQSVEAAVEPSLLHANLLSRFRERATADEVREFERLASSSDSESRSHAVELVLFKMSDSELYALGITQVEQPDGLEWAVAWSTDSPEDSAAIEAALHRAGIQVGGVGDLGSAGWYVPRERFFGARAALLADDRVRALESIHVVQPHLGRG